MPTFLINSFLFRHCEALFNPDEAKCSDLKIRLKQKPAQEFTLKLYWTQDECTLPSLANQQDFELINQVDIANLDENEVSLGNVDLSDKCGLVNLVVTISSNSIFEHLATPLFVNCSNVDFKVQVTTSEEIPTILTGQLLNGFEVSIENLGSGDCTPKTEICLTCEMEEIFHILDEPGFKSEHESILASSSVPDLLEKWSKCIPMEFETNLGGKGNNNLEISQVTVPCIHQDNNVCGIITFVDPLGKCLDKNVSNNVVITPVYLNYTENCQWEEEKCELYPDYKNKVAVSKGSIHKPRGQQKVDKNN